MNPRKAGHDRRRWLQAKTQHARKGRRTASLAEAKTPVASDTRECAAGLSIRSRDETPDSDRPERATPETAGESHLSQVGSERTT